MSCDRRGGEEDEVTAEGHGAVSRLGQAKVGGSGSGSGSGVRVTNTYSE